MGVFKGVTTIWRERVLHIDYSFIGEIFIVLVGFS